MRYRLTHLCAIVRLSEGAIHLLGRSGGPVHYSLDYSKFASKFDKVEDDIFEEYTYQWEI